MKIIHMSDIHLTTPGETLDDLDTHQRLDQALQHCAQHHPDAARIIITGDLAHWGEVQAYTALKARIADHATPVRLLLGNHDNRENFLKVFDTQPADSNGFVNFAETVDAYNFIYCDTNEPETHGGHFGANRRETLHHLLKASDNPSVIFMHHHPGPTGMGGIDDIGLDPQDSEALANLLRAHAPKVQHILFGHTHMTLSGTFAGVPYACVRSTGHQSLPNYSGDNRLHSGQFQPHYAVVNFDGDHTSICPVPFAYDGPIHRSGTGWNDWAKPETAA